MSINLSALNRPLFSPKFEKILCALREFQTMNSISKCFYFLLLTFISFWILTNFAPHISIFLIRIFHSWSDSNIKFALNITGRICLFLAKIFFQHFNRFTWIFLSEIYSYSMQNYVLFIISYFIYAAQTWIYIRIDNYYLLLLPFTLLMEISIN